MAVGRKRRQMDAERLRYKAPRTGRRVVFEDEPAKPKATKATHGGARSRTERPKYVRDLEFATRTF